MNKKSLLILEIVWITVGTISLVAGIHYAFKTGGSRVFMFLLMAAVSFLFAGVRHWQRKKH
jgi:uncharacterized membrane protein HdeD (DUF308 family)